MAYSLHEYVADFETTENDDGSMRVWLWAIRPATKSVKSKVKTGQSIESFIKHIQKIKYAIPVIYFHKLKYDAEYIIDYLMSIGFKWVDKPVTRLQMGEFTTNANHMGQLYSVDVCFEKIRIRFKDSLKLFNAREETLAKGYKLPTTKGSIDYLKYRPIGYKPTQEEIDYIKNDVFIISYILSNFREQGFKKYTASASAMYEFISVTFPRKDGKNNYKTSYNMFLERHKLTKEEDKQIRKSYTGGICYIKPGIKGIDIGEGIVYDRNSMYAAGMYNEYMPYGSPLYVKGEPFISNKYNLYVTHIKIDCSVKEDHVPVISNRNVFNSYYGIRDFITDTYGESIDLYVTSVDLELIFNNYDVYDIEYIESWSFKSKLGGYFRPYIDKFYGMKQKARKNNNEVKAQFAKIFLNGLYGKFGTNPEVMKVKPTLENDVLRYKYTETVEQMPVYVALSTFITAYARKDLVNAILANYDRFLYCDTDSIHLSGLEPANGVEIDEYKLGAWKAESTFSRARFVGPKQYVEDEYGKLNVKCAGLHSSSIKYVTFDNFKAGAEYPTKCCISVKGGRKIIDTVSTLKER